MRYLLAVSIVLLFTSNDVLGQNRAYERPAGLGRSVFMDLGAGRTMVAASQRFNFDSTHMHLMTSGSDHVLEYKGGVRLSIPVSFFNGAAPVSDGAIFVGGNVGFSTQPMMLRMDTTGNIGWCSTITNFSFSQNQILNVFVDQTTVDLFTWSSPASTAYYFVRGGIDGVFAQGVQVDVPSGTKFRIDEVLPSSVSGEYIVVGGGEPSQTEENIHVMKLNAQGVMSAISHDHGSTALNQFEEVPYLYRAENGDFLYVVLFTDGVTRSRLVRMDDSGSILWARDYNLSGDPLSVGSPIQTSDGGFLLGVGEAISGTFFMMKIDGSGVPQWTKKYEQQNSDGIPFGAWFKNDQEELLGYNSFWMTETDEDINVCDMQTYSGRIGSTVVNVPTQSVTYSSSSFTPSVAALGYEPRSGVYQNNLMCRSVGVNEFSKDDSVKLFPNPAEDHVSVDLRERNGEFDMLVFDGLGRTVGKHRVMGGSVFHLPLGRLDGGVYHISIIRDGWITAVERVVKE